MYPRPDSAECRGDRLGDRFPGKVSLGCGGEHLPGLFYGGAGALLIFQTFKLSQALSFYHALLQKSQKLFVGLAIVDLL